MEALCAHGSSLFLHAIPGVPFHGGTGCVDEHMYKRLYELSFLVLSFFMITTLKFTHRRQGFTIKPSDFLILFVAVVVPFLLSDFIQNKNMTCYCYKDGGVFLRIRGARGRTARGVWETDSVYHHSAGSGDGEGIFESNAELEMRVSGNAIKQGY